MMPSPRSSPPRAAIPDAPLPAQPSSSASSSPVTPPPPPPPAATPRGPTSGLASPPPPRPSLKSLLLASIQREDAKSIAKKLRDSLQETPTLYPFSEISVATKNCVAFPSSSFRRCSLRGKDAILFRRPFRGDPAALPARLVAVCKSHHSSLILPLPSLVANHDVAGIAFDPYRPAARAPPLPPSPGRPRSSATAHPPP